MEYKKALVSQKQLKAAILEIFICVPKELQVKTLTYTSINVNVSFAKYDWSHG